MPHLFSSNYAGLIQILPVDDHSVEIDAGFWTAFFRAAKQTGLFNSIFGTNNKIRIDRKRLLTHAYTTPGQKIAEILLWGYPSNSHGIPKKILPNCVALEKAVDNYILSGVSSWPYFIKMVLGSGIGISTASKIAYFYKLKFSSYDALILDARLIQCIPQWVPLNSGLSHLRYGNAINLYQKYLKEMHNAAAHPRPPCRPDQIEFFLFAMGHCF
jgi:hypothetical protein